MSTAESPGRRYRIAELGRLTGFSPTALRYYEQAGVLSPPERTPAGYRIYDDRDVARLRLIARAKELGCTLDEVAGLVEAWDADECGPVKHRLRALVDAKIDEVRRHLAEQAAFAAQLRATARNLTGRPVDGPCDDGCGCTTIVGADSVGSSESCGCSSAAAPEPVSLLKRPAEGAAPPLACSLSGREVEARIDDWRNVLTAVAQREVIHHGLRLVFTDPGVLPEVCRLAAAEHECCPFFEFAVTIDRRGVGLEVIAPADGQVLLGTVFGGVA